MDDPLADAVTKALHDRLVANGRKGGKRGSPKQQEARRKAATLARAALALKRAGIDQKPPQQGQEE